MIFATIVLIVIRRKLRLQRSDLSASAIDCIIPFIGGGNLQMQNKWEKWFFGILLFSAFLIVAVASGDLLDSLTNTETEKITKLKQLANINTTIYVNIDLGLYRQKVEAMIEYVS